MIRSPPQIVQNGTGCKNLCKTTNVPPNIDLIGTLTEPPSRLPYFLEDLRIAREAYFKRTTVRQIQS
jgi:hypothetical protein